MAFAEVPFFMATLRQQVGIGAKALQFTILTAARTGEVIGARWSEIDLERALWSVPAPRMKAGREHIVPLAPSAVALLRSLPVKEGIVFRADTFKPALSNAAMSAVLARMGHSAVSVHGFRASFRTWARDKRPEDREAAEVSLAHAVGDKTEQSYSRGDLMERRRPLMDAWAEFCLSNQTGLRLVG
jgi:integrase